MCKELINGFEVIMSQDVRHGALLKRLLLGHTLVSSHLCGSAWAAYSVDLCDLLGQLAPSQMLAENQVCLH